ncbi:hypothetical protein [Pseudoflavonifractor phocaeensis]|uniref:hypothetical protein n=1 Tax=Pseudoflavonifractor phocaeensis TaxID=1870988 RepID=UPI00210A9EEB|nr:hypothetical protein [Pseudoflavonifractor phocaeensis]MCQ4862710.1 hypothetical protein [Pseudoflavonifractor phocaeensis]
MWNSILKGAVSVALIICLIAAIRAKRNIRRRGVSIFFVVLSMLVLVLLSIYRVENIFYSFPTASSVADYVCNGEVVAIVDGHNSSLVVYKSEDEVRVMIAPKTSSGYKIGNLALSPIIADNNNGKYAVQILSEGNDYYTLIFGGMDSSNLNIKDSCNSEFFVYPESYIVDGMEYGKFISLALISEPRGDYSVTLTDDKQVTNISDLINFGSQ